jgi:hypothetical protein
MTIDEIERICLETETDDPAKLTQLFDDLMSGKLRDNSSAKIFGSMIRNPFLPFDKAEKLAKYWLSLPVPEDGDGDDIDHYFLSQPLIPRALCERTDASDKALAKWLYKVDPGERPDFINHPNVSHRTLGRHLNKIEMESWVWQMTQFPVSEAKEKEFATSEVGSIRSLVAASTKDTGLLKALASDQEGSVRIQVMLNPHTPLFILNEAALNERDQDVLAAAAPRLTDPELLWKVAEKIENHHHDLVEAIRKNPHSPDVAKVVATLNI